MPEVPIERHRFDSGEAPRGRCRKPDQSKPMEYFRCNEASPPPLRLLRLHGELAGLPGGYRKGQSPACHMMRRSRGEVGARVGGDGEGEPVNDENAHTFR